MSYLENLYGSQHYEISERGGDASKGRRGGNIFLAAFIILLFIAIAAVIFTFVDGTIHDVNQQFKKIFGRSSGKTIGRLLAIPLMAIIYFIISKTVGSVSNYKKYTDAFNLQSDEVKKKANIKTLRPFLIVLAVFFILAMSSLFTQ